MSFAFESWEETKSKSFKILVSKTRKKEIFNEIGYHILESGKIIDKDSGKELVGADNKGINLEESPNLALILGSHNFVRNIAEYSDLLVKNGDLKFISEKNSLSKD